MAELKYDKTGRLLFTKEMKEEYTILIPMMMPTHFNIMKSVLVHNGYKMELLDTDGPEIAQTGLKYVHNDTCYPAILVIGQLIHALESGKYDVHKTALMITQTGGGCRASNYIHLLRKALHKAGFDYVPIISLNLSGLEKNPGFSLTLPMIRELAAALVYGDVIMNVCNQTRPYEVNKGESDALVAKWTKQISEEFAAGEGYKTKEIEQRLNRICREFSQIKVKKVPRIKVGVVGEIYVKYARLGNNDLERFLAQQGCEVCLPGLMGFVLFKVDNRLEDIKLYGGSKAKYTVINALMKFLTKMEKMIIDCTKEAGFMPPTPYTHTKKLVKGVIGYGSKMGEGWLLTAEMLELAESGFENIVCAQPFGCLPNHINGKGAIRRIKSINPKANIVTIDYDPGAPKVNQENRIKLMLAVAREELDKKVSGAEKQKPAKNKAKTKNK